MRCSRLPRGLQFVFKNYLRIASVALGPFCRDCCVMVNSDGSRIIVASPDTPRDLQTQRMAGYLAW